MSWDDLGGHPNHVRTVPHLLPQGGVQRALVTDLSQTGSLREASDGGVVDHGEGDGGITPARVEVHKDGLDGDGGAVHQAPRGLTTNSSQP